MDVQTEEPAAAKRKGEEGEEGYVHAMTEAELDAHLEKIGLSPHNSPQNRMPYSSSSRVSQGFDPKSALTQAAEKNRQEAAAQAAQTEE